jgi:hypothetical protein
VLERVLALVPEPAPKPERAPALVSELEPELELSKALAELKECTGRPAAPASAAQAPIVQAPTADGQEHLMLTESLCR